MLSRSAFFVLLLTTIMLVSCSSRQEAIPEVRDNWVRVEGTFERKPLKVKYNQGLEKIAGNTSYIHELDILVQLNSPDSTGLAGNEEDAQLEEIRNTFKAHLTAERLCFFAAIASTAGTREFVFYTAQPKKAKAIADSLKSRLTSHQMKISVLRDAHWGVYKQFGSTE